MTQRILHLDFVAGSFLAEILNGDEVLALPEWSGPKPEESFGKLMPKEAKIVAKIYDLRDSLIAFKLEVEKGEREFSNAEMKEGYVEPPMKIMTLMSMLHGLLISRLERFCWGTVLAFDNLEIIKAPSGLDGSLLLGFSMPEFAEGFIGQRVTPL
jgi:hypothetical protein